MQKYFTAYGWQNEQDGILCGPAYIFTDLKEAEKSLPDSGAWKVVPLKVTLEIL